MAMRSIRVAIFIFCAVTTPSFFTLSIWASALWPKLLGTAVCGCPRFARRQSFRTGQGYGG